MIHIMETNDEKFFSVEGLSPLHSVHPGEILGEELKDRGISQKIFASSIGLQPSHLSALIHGTRNFTPSVASKIESGLPGISADYWMRMQGSYNAEIRRRKVNPSMLVSGYTHKKETPFQVLGDSAEPHDCLLHMKLSVPVDDKELLSQLAVRFGWILEEEG